MTEHDNGQTRMDVEGDQLTLVPLPDTGIPASTGPELASPALEKLNTYHGEPARVVGKTAAGIPLVELMRIPCSPIIEAPDLG